MVGSRVTEQHPFVGIVWPRKETVNLESECSCDEAVQFGVEVESRKGSNAEGNSAKPLEKTPWAQRGRKRGNRNGREPGARNEEAPVRKQVPEGNDACSLEEGVYGKVEADIRGDVLDPAAVSAGNQACQAGEVTYTGYFLDLGTASCSKMVPVRNEGKPPKKYDERDC